MPEVAEEGRDWPEGEQNFVIVYCVKFQKKVIGQKAEGEQNFVIGYCLKLQNQEVIGQKVSRTLSLIIA